MHNVILEASARACYVACWAQRASDLVGMDFDHDGGGPDSVLYAGSAIFKGATQTPTSPAAFHWSEDMWTRIVDLNPMSMPFGTGFGEQVHEVWNEAAAKAGLDPDDREAARMFGHHIAMEALGFGVWDEAHAAYRITVPVRIPDAWAFVEDADLGAVVSSDMLEEAIAENMPDEDDDEDAEDDDEDDDDVVGLMGLFQEYRGAPSDSTRLHALQRLAEHLNFAAAYENEDLTRAHAIADVLLAAEQRRQQRREGRINPGQPMVGENSDAEAPVWAHAGVRVKVKQTPITKTYGVRARAHGEDAKLRGDKVWPGEVGTIQPQQGNGWWRWMIDFPHHTAFPTGADAWDDFVRVPVKRVAR